MSRTETETKADNCRLLAAFMRTDPRVREEGRLRQETWVGEDWRGDPSLRCGTSACAAGWASTIPEFRRLGLKISKYGMVDDDVLIRIFGWAARDCFCGTNPDDPDFIADMLEEAADRLTAGDE